MALGKFLRRIFTGEADIRISDNPFPKEEILVAGVPPKTTLRQETSAAILHRDEIIDSRGRIAGYRFFVCSVGDGAAVDGAAFVDALKSEAVANFAQRRLTVIPLTMDDWHRADFQQFIAPQTIFLTHLPPVRPLPEDWLAWLTEVKASGVRLALQDAAPIADHEAALALASLVFIDSRAYSLQNFERLVKTFRQAHPGLAIAADGISSWPERRMCLSLMVDYCLGGFATTVDEEDKSQHLNQSRLVLIELINLLRRDAALNELAAMAKRDPGVALQVVAMANSPMAGLNNQVASLDQAIMVVGREVLYRWLTISMFRVGGNTQHDETLLELALARARFLELLGQQKLSRQQAEELFLVGLLSLLDSLLSMPMAKIVEKMKVSPVVADVLLHSEGAYGRYLMLALAVEKGRGEQAARLAELLDLAAKTLDKSALDAMAWAQEALSFGRA